MGNRKFDPMDHSSDSHDSLKIESLIKSAMYQRYPTSACLKKIR